MSDYQLKQRWMTADSISKLTSLLGLPSHPHMQDWELECADARRLCEFLDLYERDNLNDDDRFALMKLIVASLDECVGDSRADKVMLQRIRRHLSASFSLHEVTIHYWCLWDWDKSDPDNVFAATPFMREIWKQHIHT
jgi:hypothetical protein